MHANLLQAVVQYVNDRDVRTAMGFDFEQCIRLRVTPLSLDMTKVIHVERSYALRPEGYYMSKQDFIQSKPRALNFFSLKFYKPSSRSFIKIVRHVTLRDSLIKFRFTVITKVDLDHEEEMAVKSRKPKRSWYREITVCDDGSPPEQQTGRLSWHHCGYANHVLEEDETQV